MADSKTEELDLDLSRFSAYLSFDPALFDKVNELVRQYRIIQAERDRLRTMMDAERFAGTPRPDVEAMLKSTDPQTVAIARWIKRLELTEPLGDYSDLPEDTPAKVGHKITRMFMECERLNSEVQEVAKRHILDFHFMNYAVSNFWTCEKSPIGVCLFILDDHGRKTDCRYCNGPVERK